MPLPPPITIASPSSAAIESLMSWLDPKPTNRNVDGVEQPLCSNGRDVVAGLQMPDGVATSLAQDIDVWLSIGRIGAISIPDTVDPVTARIIGQRLRAIAAPKVRMNPPALGTPVREGLSKSSGITHREMGTGRIGRRKAAVNKASSGSVTVGRSQAGSRGGHVIGYTRSNQPIYASHHEKNRTAVAHMTEDGTSHKGVQATAEAHPSYSKKDHLDAANAHAEEAATATDKTHRHGSHMMSQAHASAAMTLSSKTHKSMAAVGAYYDVLSAAKA